LIWGSNHPLIILLSRPKWQAENHITLLKFRIA
jgi:hypothetical protein